MAGTGKRKRTGSRDGAKKRRRNKSLKRNDPDQPSLEAPLPVSEESDEAQQFRHLPIHIAMSRSTVDRLDRPSQYYLGRNKRRRFNQDRDDHDGNEKPEEPVDPLRDATTLYVGNLSFYTTEEQIHELFSKCGEVKRLVMGLDRYSKTPCGFCFVEYYSHQDAIDCMKYIGGTKLDERIIRTDLDPGFQEGRQYGRGKSGGQVRDEYRDEYDPGRGGYGRAIAEERRKEEEEYGRGK